MFPFRPLLASCVFIALGLAAAACEDVTTTGDATQTPAGLPAGAGVTSLASPAFFLELVAGAAVQGVLTDADGAPLEGAVNVRFALYASADGATPLWQEQHTLDLDAGVFGAFLGESTPLDADLLDDHVQLWLGVTVADDGEMQPRVALPTVPYAAVAGVADEAYSAETLQGATLAELTYSAGSGLTLDGQTFAIDPAAVAAAVVDDFVTPAELDARLAAAGDDFVTPAELDARLAAETPDNFDAVVARGPTTSRGVTVGALSISGCKTVSVTRAMPPGYGYSTYVLPGAGADAAHVAYCGAGFQPVKSGCRLTSWQDLTDASQFYKVNVWASGIRADGTSECRAYNQSNRTVSTFHDVRCCPITL